MASKNVETLRNAHQNFCQKLFDKAEKLAANNLKLIDHGRGLTMNSRQEFRGWMAAFFEMSSNMKLVDARYIDAGEYVIAQFSATGTQDGPMGPFPPSNKPYRLDVCEVWRFNANGEAVEGHNYSDGMGLAMQLGHIPA